MHQKAEGTYRIGDCVLDIAAGTVSCGNSNLHMRRQSFLLLCLLARNMGRVVSKRELLDEIWPDVIVTEDSLTQCVKDLRQALPADDASLLRTVPRRGYMLAGNDPDTPRPVANGGIPVVTVLGFRNLASGETDAWLGAGIAEEIALGLARFRSIAVRMPADAIEQADDRLSKRPDAALPGSMFYEVRGTVLRQDPVLRIAVSLVSAADGSLVWSGNFTCRSDDVFSAISSIAGTITSQLATTIEQGTTQKAMSMPTEDIRAFEWVVKGINFLKSFGENANEKGRAAIEKAVALDPRYALAQAYLALADVMVAGYGAAPKPVLADAYQRALGAIELEETDSRIHRIAGLLAMYLRERSRAESHFRKACDINPFDADSLAQLGYLRTIRGFPLEGLEWMQRAMDLKPRHPDWYHADRSMMLYCLGRYREAAEELEMFPLGGVLLLGRLAAALAMDGDAARAGAIMLKALDLPQGNNVIDHIVQSAGFESDTESLHLRDGLMLALKAATSPP